LGKRSAAAGAQTPQGFPVGNVVQLGFLSCAGLSIGMREQPRTVMLRAGLEKGGRSRPIENNLMKNDSLNTIYQA